MGRSGPRAGGPRKGLGAARWGDHADVRRSPARFAARHGRLRRAGQAGGLLVSFCPATKGGNLMRRILTSLLALGLAGSLAACQNEAEAPDAPDAQTGTVERTAPEEQTGTVERTGPEEQTGTVERTGPEEQTGTVERTGPEEQ